MKIFYVILADGFEEVEAITPIDYLMRVGVQVIKLGLGHEVITSSRGIKIFTDLALNDENYIDILNQVKANQVLGFCLPGGLGGSKNIANSTMCETLCKTCLENNGLVSAICAAPALALGKWGILKDKKFTCFPNMEEEVAPELRQGFLQDRVVIDGNLITARGAGVAEEFSFAIIEALCEKNAVNSLKEKIVAR